MPIPVPWRRRDPQAPSGVVVRGGIDLPNWIVPTGLHGLYRSTRVVDLIARHFNRAYYYALDTLFGRTWLGTSVLKYPTDLWIYQEIMTEVRPAVVLETGTYLGGSALFLATVLDALGGEGRVISIDVNRPDGLPEHARITYITGSSVDPATVEHVRDEVGDASPVLVILDSDHARDHVLRELRAYADLVGSGSYLIVEDTIVNGNPVLPKFGPGPAEAVSIFLRERDDFGVDRSREELLVTSNPGGYLRRIR